MAKGLWFGLLSLILVGGAFAATADRSDSLGNVDSVLTWTLGDLEPGQTSRCVVLFAFAESYEALLPLLERTRTEFATPSTRSLQPQGDRTEPHVWIANEVTNFALDAWGSFFHEIETQALRTKSGGQLSRYGYFIHYGNSGEKHAGISIGRGQPGTVENLRIVEATYPLGPTREAGIVETEDKALRLVSIAEMGEDSSVGIEYKLTNTSKQTLRDVRFSVYSNLESNHSSDNDYGTLDRRTGACLVLDMSSDWCVAMAGLTPPANGYSGYWSSESQLRQGSGCNFDDWRDFNGIPDDLIETFGRSIIPHPPAVYVDAREPETRTLSAEEARQALQRDWLFQTDGQPYAVRALHEIGWTRELAARLSAKPAGPDFGAELDALRAVEGDVRALSSEDAESDRAKELYLHVRELKHRIAFRNPLLDFDRMLFIDQPYPQGAEWRHQARHRNGMMAVPGGRLLVLDGLQPGGAIKKLAPENPGAFWKPDVSFDGRRILFCYKAEDESGFHLYEINADGTGLRQLTDSDYDDIDPIYLPDGKIIFSTTRCNTYVRCMPYTYSYVLARCDADGGNLYLISTNNEPDWLPTLLDDGRVIFSRWEYTDKALWRIQSLWTINPDGTNINTFWGNQSVWPDHLTEAQPIPGSSRVMFTGVAHHDWFAGSIGILDTRKGFNFPAGLTKVTCDVAWPECGEPPIDAREKETYHASGKYSAYKSPYPLSEEDFLVSACGLDDKFRLYLMDVYGNRELIYEGAFNIWHAMPLRPRPVPPHQIDRVAWPGTGANRTPVEPALFYSADIYQNVPDLPRGSVKYVRVLQIDSKTASSWVRDSRFSGPGTSILQDDGVKRILGTVPVDADGSVYFKVPPGRSLHLQVLDERYRALQTMRTFCGAMPGEKRGCVGCHELHSKSPVNKVGTAMMRAPAELTPPPWGAERTISYERLVQPVLDRYCGDCHQGEGKARAKLDLTHREGGKWFFPEPYLTLVGDLPTVGPGGKPGIAGALLCENYEQSDPRSYVTLRPMQFLSRTSKLIEIASSGMHHDVRVDDVSLHQLIGWVDANCPYRGDDEVRSVPDPTFPGVELLPIRPRCKTAPVVMRP